MMKLVGQLKHLKKQSSVNLNLALLGHKGSYIAYRFRYFMLNNVLLLVLHLVEFYVLSLFFHANQFFSLILLRAMIWMIKDGWWGALEELRQSIRYLRFNREIDAIPQQISLWFGVGLLLSLGCLIVGMISLLLFHYHYHDFYFIIYGMAMIFQLSVDIVLRVLHSGIYSLSRIFRPWWTIFLPELLSCFIVLSLWTTAKVWAVPAAYVVSSVVALILTGYYTVECYRSQGLSPLVKLSWSQLQNACRRVNGMSLVLAGMAGIVMSLEGALFWFFQPALQADPLIFKLLYLLGPHISASFNWARITYFDFNKLASSAKHFLLPPFYRSLVKFSTFLGVFFWGLGALTSRFLLPDISWSILLYLLPFFIMRSLLALRQMYFFANHYYGDVLLSAVFMVLAGIASIFLKTPHELCLLLFLMLTVALLVAVKRWFRGFAMVNKSKFTPIYVLIRKLKKIKPPIYMTCLSIVPALEMKQHFVFLQELSNVLQGYGVAVRCFNKKIICVQSRRNDTEWRRFLEIEAVGRINQFRETVWQTNATNNDIKQFFCLTMLKNSDIGKELGIPSAQALNYFRQDFPRHVILPWQQLSRLSQFLPELNVSAAKYIIKSLSQVWQQGLCCPVKEQFNPIFYQEGGQSWCLLAYVDASNVKKFKTWQRYCWNVSC